MNEVHALIASHPRRWKFALCGSNARKLRRIDTNLLAGRAVNRTFFPLVRPELGGAIAVDDILEAYASNYLREEIQQEGLTTDLAVTTGVVTS